MPVSLEPRAAERTLAFAAVRNTAKESRRPMSDSYLIDAGWLFFAVLSIVVIVVSWAAFGPDLFPEKSRLHLRELQGSEPSSTREPLHRV